MNVANGYWIPLLRARGISTVVNVDGLEWRREKWGRLAKVVFWVGAKLTARYADELIFDAQSIGDYWRNKFGRDGTFIPYGGESFAGPLMNRDQHLGAGRYVLLVARFVPENTVAEFFSIAPDLSRSHPVVLVGSGTRDGALERAAGSLARSYPNIFWLGHVSDDERLFSLWANAGVYFHGHSVGGTNPALVQAMACGAPIVARDTPFNREVLDTAGVFVKPTDETIKTAILELMGSLPRREQLSHKARARAARIYNWESICENYERLLENRVRRSGSQRAGRHAPASPPS
jgi:glycosyltransferase involved in cell wall biosynthesis